MQSAHFRVEASHLKPQNRGYRIEKTKPGLSLAAAEAIAHKWAKADYFVRVIDEDNGDCVAEAGPAESD